MVLFDFIRQKERIQNAMVREKVFPKDCVGGQLSWSEMNRAMDYLHPRRGSTRTEKFSFCVSIKDKEL
jgi:hypothetical protein